MSADTVHDSPAGTMMFPYEEEQTTTWLVCFQQGRIQHEWRTTTSMAELFQWENHWRDEGNERFLYVFKIISEGPINVVSQTTPNNLS